MIVCTDALWNLIKRLLEKDPEKRLGTKDVNEIKQHSFFKTIDWSKIEQGPLKIQLSNTINKNFKSIYNTLLISFIFMYN